MSANAYSRQLQPTALAAVPQEQAFLGTNRTPLAPDEHCLRLAGEIHPTLAPRPVRDALEGLAIDRATLSPKSRIQNCGFVGGSHAIAESCPPRCARFWMWKRAR